MTYEEMERTLVQLAGLQRDNQQLLREAVDSMKRLSELVVSFSEQQNARTVSLEDALIRLTALVEAFVRGSRNGGKQE